MGAGWQRWWREPWRPDETASEYHQRVASGTATVRNLRTGQTTGPMGVSVAFEAGGIRVGPVIIDGPANCRIDQITINGVDVLGRIPVVTREDYDRETAYLLSRMED